MASLITSLTIVYSTVYSDAENNRNRKKSKHRVTGLCEGNSPVTGEYPAQRGRNAENVYIWWRHESHKTNGLLIFSAHISALCADEKCQFRVKKLLHRMC